MSELTLLPICITMTSFPYYTISQRRQPTKIGYDELWDNHIDCWHWTMVDNKLVKAFDFYDGWRIIDETI